MRHTPMRRFGEPEELIGALLLLVSPKAGRFITGTHVNVDGGFTGRGSGEIIAVECHCVEQAVPGVESKISSPLLQRQWLALLKITGNGDALVTTSVEMTPPLRYYSDPNSCIFAVFGA